MVYHQPSVFFFSAQFCPKCPIECLKTYAFSQFEKELVIFFLHSLFNNFFLLTTKPNNLSYSCSLTLCDYNTESHVTLVKALTEKHPKKIYEII